MESIWPQMSCLAFVIPLMTEQAGHYGRVSVDSPLWSMDQVTSTANRSFSDCHMEVNIRQLW